MRRPFRYLLALYALAFGCISVLVFPEAIRLMWPFFLFPLLSLVSFLLCCLLGGRDDHKDVLASFFSLFLPRPDRLPRELTRELHKSIERPLYNLWRTGMAVPLCFAAAYWIIIHIVFGGDQINARSWFLLATGGGIAVLTLLFSRRLSAVDKLLWIGLTVMAYPLLFAGAMWIGFMVDIFHCFGVGWH